VLMKLFQGFGPATEISKIENEVNAWLSTLPTDVEVKHVTTTLTAVASSGGQNPRPSLVITVWWDQR
jgi:hypothetical protein